MSALPSGAIARVRWGLRFGDVDWYQRDPHVEVVVRFDDGETVMFHGADVEELVWLRQSTADKSLTGTCHMV